MILVGMLLEVVVMKGCICRRMMLVLVLFLAVMTSVFRVLV